MTMSQKIFLTFAVIFSSFFLAQTAAAFEFKTFDESTRNATGTVKQGATEKTWLQTIKPTANSEMVNWAAYVQADAVSGSNNYTWYFFGPTSTQPTGLNPWNDCGPSHTGTKDITSTTPHWETITLAHTLEKDQYYCMELTPAAGADGLWWFGKSPSSTYDNGLTFYNAIPAEVGFDLAVTTNYTGTEWTDDIQIWWNNGKPAEITSLDEWPLSVDISDAGDIEDAIGDMGGGVYWPWFIRVYYGASEENLVASEDKNWLDWLIDPWTLDPYIVENQNFPRTVNWQAGWTISAQAVIKNYAGTTLAESDFWTFTVSTTNYTDPIDIRNYNPWLISTTTIATSSDYVCGGIDGVLDLFSVNRGLCILYDYLLNPSEEAVSQFFNLKNTVANKPPFGYFTIFKNALDGLVVSSTYSIADTSTLAFLENFTILDDIKTFFSWLLYFALVVAIIFRIKHLIL